MHRNRLEYPSILIRLESERTPVYRSYLRAILGATKGRPCLGPLIALPFYDFDLRASHARTLLPAALASVPFGFVLVRVRVRIAFHILTT